ncbi:MAG: PDZ domain-containing protein [Oscillospiraceae bacterium]|nr:PDZ domain-containing protein [Oscillospiraceae bacterium]
MKKMASRLAVMLFTIFILCECVCAAEFLIPGGQLIGLQLKDNTVTVAAFDDALGTSARTAGLKVGDKIIKIDEKTVTCAEDVRNALTCSDGQVDVAILRDGKTKKLKLRPNITPNGPKLGVYLKQGTTGVGTVTYYDPDTGSFGCLGHGVNTASGDLMPMQTGTAHPASIVSVKKGAVGQPGQIIGCIKAEQLLGTLAKNAQQGVFGKIEFPNKEDAMPIGSAQTGKATIRSTVRDQGLQEYSVEILKIYPNTKTGCRNMLLKITDPALLEATGGIVQGMSGSPIIQDGKLVGAVTHVLVNDPTTGYGIFIENMLDAAA